MSLWRHQSISREYRVYRAYRDNITRRIPLLSQVNGQLYPSMALEIIRVLQDKKSYSLKADWDGIKELKKSDIIKHHIDLHYHNVHS